MSSANAGKLIQAVEEGFLLFTKVTEFGSARIACTLRFIHPNSSFFCYHIYFHSSYCCVFRLYMYDMNLCACTKSASSPLPLSPSLPCPRSFFFSFTLHVLLSHFFFAHSFLPLTSTVPSLCFLLCCSLLSTGSPGAHFEISPASGDRVRKERSGGSGFHEENI